MILRTKFSEKDKDEPSQILFKGILDLEDLMIIHRINEINSKEEMTRYASYNDINSNDFIYYQNRYDNRYDLESFISYDILQFNYQSLLILIYSILERTLILFAESLKRKNNLSISLSDLKGGLLIRIETYFRLVNLQINSFDDWKTIQELSLVRNCIVHSLGHVERDYLKKVLVNSSDISIKNDAVIEYLEIEQNYIIEKINSLKSFLKQLFDTIK